MNTITISTNTVVEEPVLFGDKLIIKTRKMNNFIKTWYCEPISTKEFEQLLDDIKQSKIITLKLQTKGKSGGNE
ncbi:MAG: hypothetical protein EOL97_09870 [Spirochaetia bacterium]|nr:hypothetical protein [Spirochaetia bacterium]